MAQIEGYVEDTIGRWLSRMFRSRDREHGQDLGQQQLQYLQPHDSSRQAWDLEVGSIWEGGNGKGKGKEKAF